MIQKLIALLQWFEASEKPKRWFDLLFSFTFTASSISLVYTILGETLFRSSYYY